MRTDLATRQNDYSSRSFGPSSRRGDVLDGLVFMMAGVLLVGWILGHLFLAFYPPTASAADFQSSTASLNSTATDGKSARYGTDIDDPNMPTEDGGFGFGTDSDSDLNTTSRELPDAAGDSEDAEIKKYVARTGELQSEIDSLKTANQQLMAEISSLKNAAALTPMATDEAEVNKLRVELKSANEQLATAERNADAANEKLRVSNTSYQDLQTRLSEVQAKLKQSESDLEIAKTAADLDATSPFADMPNENQSAAEMEALAEKVKQANAKIGEFQIRIASLEEDLKTTNNKVIAREKELEVAQLATTQLKTRNDELVVKLQNAANTPLAVELPKEVYRDFVSSKGSVSKMAFIRWEGVDEIIVRSFADKRLYRLPLERFSEADKQYLLDRK